jgi:hypothetical protein
MALERIQDARAPGPALEARAQRRSFTSEARAGAWVRPDGDIEAVFARSDLVGLTPGQQGTFFRAAAPAAALAVTLSPEPARPGGASLAKVSFRPGRGTRAGDAGEIGWIVIPATTREHLVIPSSAVLQSSRGPYVLVPASTRGDFRARAIEVGKVVQGAAIVLSGLREGEPVVVGDAFFLDAERRLADERRSSSEVGR